MDNRWEIGEELVGNLRSEGLRFSSAMVFRSYADLSWFNLARPQQIGVSDGLRTE